MTDSQLTEMMHRAGVRPSVQRIAVLAMIADPRLHPSAEEIFSALARKYPSLSRTTVYNSLHAFADSGLVRELETGAGYKRFDLAALPHAHFTCTLCGAISDLPLPQGLETSLPEGYRLGSTELHYRGLCPACAAAAGNETEITHN